MLTIIGIKFDADALTMTMPPDTLNKLIIAIRDFIMMKHKFTLREWQRLVGWINWSFNVFPLLRPALNNFYTKIAGKCAPNKYIRINKAVCMDLLWAVKHLEFNTGVHLIHHLYWDACLEEMGFWLPDKCISYYSPVPETTNNNQIFYFEALCVLSAIHHVTAFLCVHPASRILIYTDNDNTVAIFNTL